MSAVSEGQLYLRIHLDEVVLHHAKIAFFDLLSYLGLEGKPNLGVDHIDYVLKDSKSK